MLENLLKLHAQGQDNVLLRFSLGSEYLKAGEYPLAESHLRAALQHDPGYSAAWKLLGKTQAAGGRHQQALETFQQGISTAQQNGDIQAAKEMEVFLRRSRKALQQG